MSDLGGRAALGGRAVAVKICGLTRREDIDAVNAHMPEYIGFVFAKSKRRVTPREAREMRAALDPGILAVGVFVDEEPENVADVARGGAIDLIQLHGSEDKAYIRAIKKLTGKPVIRAVSAPSGATLDARERFTRAYGEACEGEADYLLFDGAVAGSGVAFDWARFFSDDADDAEDADGADDADDADGAGLPARLGANNSLVKPFFLAGGLNPANARAAADFVRPFALDVSSGVETNGVKDGEKISEFIRRVRHGRR